MITVLYSALRGSRKLYSDIKETASLCSALLISWGYEQNGIAGEKFAERLNKEILKKL